MEFFRKILGDLFFGIFKKIFGGPVLWIFDGGTNSLDFLKRDQLFEIFQKNFGDLFFEIFKKIFGGPVLWNFLKNFFGGTHSLDFFKIFGDLLFGFFNTFNFLFFLF